MLTDGETGGYDTSIPREDMPNIRRAEQQKAATSLGVKDVRFVGLAEVSCDRVICSCDENWSASSGKCGRNELLPGVRSGTGSVSEVAIRTTAQRARSY